MSRISRGLGIHVANDAAKYCTRRATTRNTFSDNLSRPEQNSRGKAILERRIWYIIIPKSCRVALSPWTNIQEIRGARRAQRVYDGAPEQ